MVVGKSLNITGIDCFMPAFFPYFLLFCYVYNLLHFHFLLWKEISVGGLYT